MIKKIINKIKRKIIERKQFKKIERECLEETRKNAPKLRAKKRFYNDYIKRLDVAPKTTGKLKTLKDYNKEMDSIYGYQTPYSDTCEITEETLIGVQERLEGRVITRLYFKLYFERIMQTLNKWEKDINDC